MVSKNFPSAVPANVTVPHIEQRDFVIDGDVETWPGAVSKVESPVYVGDKPQVLGFHPEFDEAQVLKILDSSVGAYDKGEGEWPSMSVKERCEHMLNFIGQVNKKREPVANSLMWEVAKRKKDSFGEFDRTVQYTKDTVAELGELSKKNISEIIAGYHKRGGRSPRGVTLSVAPYNYPFNELYTTLIPLVLMGNPVILKPAKNGVLLHQPLLEAYASCFPKGVINTLYGDGFKVIPPVMTSGKTQVLAFIGSNGAANAIQKLHPNPNELYSILGLGAKNLNVVLPSADLEEAATMVSQSQFSFNGQRCTADKMTMIHDKIYDAFMALYLPKVKALSVGMPWDDTFITPLMNMTEVQKMNNFVVEAVAKGAQLLYGGDFDRTLYTPAVLANVNESMSIYRREQFGPVAPLARFSDLREPVAYQKGSEVGQQVSIFGYDANEVGYMVDGFVDKVSRTNLNGQCQRGPDMFAFTGRGGAAKGVLSVLEALLTFSQETFVAAQATPRNLALAEELKKTSRFYQ